MTIKPRTFAALLAAATMLSGCQSFPLTAWMFKSHDHPADRPAPMLAGAQVLEEGRAQLGSGQISAAIASFRMARRDPATAADATNGLAVAYARLGRPDLADRYFREALAIEPDNEHFAANLLRLRHQVMLAQREQEERVALAAPEQDQGQQLATAATPINRGQAVVHIVTRQNLGNAPETRVVAVAERDDSTVQTGHRTSGHEEGAPVPKEVIFNR